MQLKLNKLVGLWSLEMYHTVIDNLPYQKKNTFMLIIDSKLKKHCEEVPDLIHAEVDSVIGLGMSREGFFS